MAGPGFADHHGVGDEGSGAEGEIEIPREHGPLAAAFRIAVDVVILRAAVDILHDADGRHVVDLGGQIDIVEEKGFEWSAGLGDAVDEGDEIGLVLVQPGLLLPGRERFGWFAAAARSLVEGTVGIEIPASQKITIGLFDQDRDIPEGVVLPEVDMEGFGEKEDRHRAGVVAENRPDIAFVGVGRVEVDLIDPGKSVAESEVVSVVELDLVALLGPVDGGVAADPGEDVVKELAVVEKRAARAVAVLGVIRVL